LLVVLKIVLLVYLASVEFLVDPLLKLAGQAVNFSPTAPGWL
jgi:hypothetical protein